MSSFHFKTFQKYLFQLITSWIQSLYSLTFVKTSGIPGLAQDEPQEVITN